MSFTMAQYLQDYRKEDIATEQQIIKTKWKKTVAVIKEAFSDKYVSVAEAKRIIRNEYAKGDCPAHIDQNFLKENIEYIIEKVDNLSEGDIRIIINNGNKEPKVKSVDIEDIDEAKGKKSKKKDKKEVEDDEPIEPIGEPEEEVIIDEPTDADAIAVSTAEAPEASEVLITFDKDSKTLSVKEGEDVIEEFEIEDQSALKQVVDFLKDFYSKHDYIVNEEGLEDIGEVEDEGEKEPEGEESEKEGGEVEAPEGEEGEKEEEIEEYALPEGKRFTFADLLLEEEETEVVEEAEGDKPKCSDLVGKAIEVKGKWYTVQECDDGNMLKVLGKDGQSSVVDIKDVTDWEKDVLPKKEVTEAVSKTYRGINAQQAKAIKSYVTANPDVIDIDEIPNANEIYNMNQHELFWQVANRYINDIRVGQVQESVVAEGAKKVPKMVKKDVKSQSLTKTPMKKTGQKVLTVKVPKMVKKGESNKALTKTPMKSTGSKVPAIKKVTVTKKDAPTSALTAKPSAPKGKVSTVAVPKQIVRDVKSKGYSKSPKKLTTKSPC